MSSPALSIADDAEAPKRPAVPTHDDELIDTAAMAAIRGIPVSRVNKERLTGDGPPFIKDGHLVRYRFGDYRAWLAAKRRFTSTSEAEAA
jgi:hypothetical protein